LGKSGKRSNVNEPNRQGIESAVLNKAQLRPGKELEQEASGIFTLAKF
jgi:hypothetical protein